jgi:hypothetical protein
VRCQVPREEQHTTKPTKSSPAGTHEARFEETEIVVSRFCPETVKRLGMVNHEYSHTVAQDPMIQANIDKRQSEDENPQELNAYITKNKKAPPPAQEIV